MRPFRSAVPAALVLPPTAGPALDVKGGGSDTVDCGPGLDRVAKDRSDHIRNCEVAG